jgi:type IV pilus assembly protein PilA
MIELLVTVAIIGMLSAMAIAGYRRYVHAAQSSEVRVVFGQIRNGEEAYRAEMLKYLSVSGSFTDYYPNGNPNDDSRWVWERPADSRYVNTSYTGWALRNVHPESPVRYGYVVMADVAPNMPGSLDPSFANPPQWPTNLSDGTPWFVVAARNKHNASMAPSLAVATSWDGTVYSEGDGD